MPLSQKKSIKNFQRKTIHDILKFTVKAISSSTKKAFSFFFLYKGQHCSLLFTRYDNWCHARWLLKTIRLYIDITSIKIQSKGLVICDTNIHLLYIFDLIWRRKAGMTADIEVSSMQFETGIHLAFSVVKAVKKATISIILHVTWSIS